MASNSSGVTSSKVLCRRRVLNQSTHSIAQEFDVVDRLDRPLQKRTALGNCFCLEQSDCRLRKGVVVGVADASN